MNEQIHCCFVFLKYLWWWRQRLWKWRRRDWCRGGPFQFKCQPTKLTVEGFDFENWIDLKKWGFHLTEEVSVDELMLEYVESVRRRPEEQRLTFFLVKRDFQVLKILQSKLWYFWHLQSSTQMLPQEKSRPARASARSETAAYADTWNQNLLLKIPYFTFKPSS